MDTYTHTTHTGHTGNHVAKSLYRGTQIVWYVLGVIEILLAFRFILKMMSANPMAGFSSFIYGLSWPLVQPFMSVFNISEVSRMVFEWPTVLAMVVYWLLALGVIRLLTMSHPISSHEAASKLKRKM